MNINKIVLNEITNQIEIDQPWNEDLSDYIGIKPPIIKTLNDHINECLRSEILSVYDNIERVFFSFYNENERIGFIRSVKNKVEFLLKKSKSCNDPFKELFIKHISQLELNIYDRYKNELNDSPNLDDEKEIQGKNQKIKINLTRDQFGALIYLFRECNLIDSGLKNSQLARTIKSTFLLLDDNQNHGPAEAFDVLLSQMKEKDYKDYGKILRKVIDKLKTSPTFVTILSQ